MPLPIPGNFGDVTKAGTSSGFTKIRGIYRANIYKIEKLSHKRKGKGDVEFPAYRIDFRINGGEFDGEDVDTYVALYSDAIFTLQQILSAIGELETYYKKAEGDEKGKWVALPAPEDLQGKELYIQVDNAPWQSTDRETKVGLRKNGEPVLMEGNGISMFFTTSKPVPEYRPRDLKPQLAKVQQQDGGGFTGGSGFPGQVTDVQPQGNAQAQDVWGSGTGASQQPGTAGW